MLSEETTRLSVEPKVKENVRRGDHDEIFENESRLVQEEFCRSSRARFEMKEFSLLAEERSERRVLIDSEIEAGLFVSLNFD